jgi:hypothetical protein
MRCHVLTRVEQSYIGTSNISAVEKPNRIRMRTCAINRSKINDNTA